MRTTLKIVTTGLMALTIAGATSRAALLPNSCAAGPVISFFNGPANSVQYDAVTDTLTVQAPGASIVVTTPPPIPITGSTVVNINVNVNDLGNLGTQTTANNLLVQGTVTISGTPYSGVLLSGKVNAFGPAEVGATDEYDFLFTVTGGEIASYFPCTIKVHVLSASSTFAGSFATSFSGIASGTICNTSDTVAPVMVCSNQVVFTTLTNNNGCDHGSKAHQDSNYCNDTGSHARVDNGSNSESSDDNNPPSHGGTVTYNKPKATDNCSGTNVVVVCTPPSGDPSLASLGSHTINCTATDPAGNSSSCSFTLTVLSPVTCEFESPLLNFKMNPTSCGVNKTILRFTPGCVIQAKVNLYNANHTQLNASQVAAYTAHIDVTERQGSYTNSTLVADIVEQYSLVGSPGGTMVPYGDNLQYNLKTNGYEPGTVNNTRFFQIDVTIRLNSAPSVVIGSCRSIMESKCN